jgi:hypothetical protein
MCVAVTLIEGQGRGRIQNAGVRIQEMRNRALTCRIVGFGTRIFQRRSRTNHASLILWDKAIAPFAFGALQFRRFPISWMWVESGIRPEGPRELSPGFTLENAF